MEELDHEARWSGKQTASATATSRRPKQPGVWRLMRWGRFDADARAAIGTLDRRELVSKGMTRRLAEAWRDFYRDVKTWDPANPSAAGRADLMDWVAQLLHDV